MFGAANAWFVYECNSTARSCLVHLQMPVVDIVRLKYRFGEIWICLDGKVIDIDGDDLTDLQRLNLSHSVDMRKHTYWSSHLIYKFTHDNLPSNSC